MNLKPRSGGGAKLKQALLPHILGLILSYLILDRKLGIQLGSRCSACMASKEVLFGPLKSIRGSTEVYSLRGVTPMF